LALTKEDFNIAIFVMGEMLNNHISGFWTKGMFDLEMKAYCQVLLDKGCNPEQLDKIFKANKMNIEIHIHDEREYLV
jgi:hypothetical protein